VYKANYKEAKEKFFSKLHVCVPNVDEIFDKAINAGCEIGGKTKRM
jgi:hypothetical protein